MIDTLNYNEVPFHFVHCFRTECPKASSCLRYQATRFLSADKRCVKALNPTFVGNPAECQEYLSDTPVIYASGISRLFDELPYAKAKDVKDDIISLIDNLSVGQVAKLEDSCNQDLALMNLVFKFLL